MKGMVFNMDRKKYFSDLYTLFEASNIGMTGSPEVIPQENIADTGLDMGGEAVDPNAMAMSQDPTMMQVDPSIQMSDPMMDPNAMTPEPQDSATVTETEKFKKLFSLFEDLIDYSNVFSENLKFVDIGLLTKDTVIKMKRYTDNIKDMNDKITNYLINIFNKETYERALYTYILFRTELITSIKGLRGVLDLDHPDRELDKKE